MVTPFLPDDEKIPAIREALPSTAAGIYLNTGSAGPLPRETARAMAEAEAWELRTGRADRNYWQDGAGAAGRGPGGGGGVLGTDPGRIALTHAATDGMNVATWAIDWQAGDRAVTTSLEHAGGLGPLWALRERRGVELDVADLGMGGDPASAIEAMDRAIGPGTRLVSLSHVSWATGARLPVREIAEIAHARGALVAVDGAQAVGAIPVSVEELGVDFYSVPAQKWLLGPEGIGRALLRPFSAGPAAPDLRRLAELRVDGSRGAGQALAGRPPLRELDASRAVGRWASPEARPGCRCSSGCRGSTSGSRRLAGAGGGDAGRGPRRGGADAARSDGRPGQLPDRGLGGVGRRCASWSSGRSASPERSRRSTRSGSASASSTPRRSCAASATASPWSPPTPRRRSRTAPGSRSCAAEWTRDAPSRPGAGVRSARVGGVAQLVRARLLYSLGWRFESSLPYQPRPSMPRVPRGREAETAVDRGS